MVKAAGFFDSATMALACPVCGQRVHQTLGDGRRGIPARCPHGHVFREDGDRIDRELRLVEERLVRSGQFDR